MATYNELEKGKSEKRQHQLYYKLAFVLGALIISFFVLVIIGYKPNEVFLRSFSSDAYFLKKSLVGVWEFILTIKDFTHVVFLYLRDVLTNNTAFDYNKISYFWSAISQVDKITIEPPKIVLERGLEDKNGWHVIFITSVYIGMYFYIRGMFKGKKREWKKFIYYPVSALFLGSLSQNDRERFMFKGNWIEEFKNNFFKRFVTEVDGYKRVPFLDYWSRYKEVLKGEREKYSNHFDFLRQLFIDDEHLEDLFCIVEGYMTNFKEKKKSLSEEFVDLLKSLISRHKHRKETVSGKAVPYFFDKFIEVEKKDFPKYQCFNGKDEVTLSMSAIMYFVDNETRNFEKTLRTKGFKGRSKLAQKIVEFENYFKQYPDKYLKMLFGVNNGKEGFTSESEEEWYFNLEQKIQNNKITKEDMQERLLFTIVTYFRFVVLRECILRYMNLPAGTIVVKIRDYTLRMIIDSYASKNVIQIVKNKNDGSNKEFESDVLANVFLYAFWFYSDLITKTKLQDRLDYHFNTDVLKIVDREVDKDVEKFVNDNLMVNNTGNTEK